MQIMELSKDVPSRDELKDEQQPARFISRTNTSTDTSEYDQRSLTDSNHNIQDDGAKKPSVALSEKNDRNTNEHDNPPKRSHKKKRPNGKPKRPLSAYNFFFRDERKAILKEQESENKNRLLQEYEESGSQDAKRATNTRGEALSSRSSSSAIGIMTNPSNIHQFPPIYHIPYQNLTKVIGERWKTIDLDRKRRYQDMAYADLNRYTAEKKVYEEKLKHQTEQAEDESTAEIDDKDFVSRLHQCFLHALSTYSVSNPGNSFGYGAMDGAQQSVTRINHNQTVLPSNESQFQAYLVNDYQQISTSPYSQMPISQNLNPPQIQSQQLDLASLIGMYRNNSPMNAYTMNSILQHSVNNIVANGQVGRGLQGEISSSVENQNQLEMQNAINQNIKNIMSRLMQLLSFQPQNEVERQLLILQLQQLYRASKANEFEIQSLLLKALQDQTKGS